MKLSKKKKNVTELVFIIDQSGSMNGFERLTMAEYEAEMAGIYSTCVLPNTPDESPMAYKSITTIESRNS